MAGSGVTQPAFGDERTARLARNALFGAMVVSALAILVLGRSLSFWSDELEWLTFQDDFGIRGLVTPHGSHLMATNRIIYEGLPRLFGTSYMPFRLVAIVLLFACAWFVFVLVRRRLGGMVALCPAIVLLFFGSAQDIALSPLGIPFTLSIALGLAAFVTAERGDRRGDVLTFLLLSASILSHTFGTIIAIGVGVHLLLEPGARRRIWAVAIPLAAWFAWWVWARQFHQGVVTGEGLGAAPLRLVEAAGAAIEGAVGIPPQFGHKSDLLETGFGILFDLIAVAGAGLLAIRIRRHGATSWLWAYITCALIFWAGIALADPSDREPATPRYLYFGAIMIVLIAAETTRGHRFGRRARRWLLALFAVALVGNVAQLLYSVPGLNDDAAQVRSQIGVMELDAEWIDPTVRVRELGAPAALEIAASIGEIAAFDDGAGQLGFTPDEIGEQSEELRLGSDYVLTRALDVALVPVPGRSPLPPADCTVHTPGADGYTKFPLAFGGNLIELGGPPGDPAATVEVGRFADAPSVPIGELAHGGRSAILIPDDGVPEHPWTARTTGRLRVCVPS